MLRKMETGNGNAPISPPVIPEADALAEAVRDLATSAAVFIGSRLYALKLA